MPPRPPITTLAIHTWKDHGKPKPLTNHAKSEASARSRISRSMSHDTHLVINPHSEDGTSTNSTLPSCVARSMSLEDNLNRTTSHLQQSDDQIDLEKRRNADRISALLDATSDNDLNLVSTQVERPPHGYSILTKSPKKNSTNHKVQARLPPSGKVKPTKSSTRKRQNRSVDHIPVGYRNEYKSFIQRSSTNTGLSVVSRQ